MTRGLPPDLAPDPVDGRSVDLLAIAEQVAAGAKAGEAVEVYVARSRSTTVKAYAGEVESFTSAVNEGIGVRVVGDGRQGFAHAGTLAEDARAEVLTEARDNMAFGEADRWAGLAEPDGVVPVEIDPWSDDLLALEAGTKIDLALDLERRVLAGDPRIKGVRTASFADSAGESAVATSTGIRAAGRGTYCSAAVSAMAGDGDETMMGYGYDAAHGPDGLDVEQVAVDAVERATRLLGAAQPESVRLSAVLEPRHAASLLGIVGGMLGGERVLKGRSPFAERVGEAIASPLLTLTDDPTAEGSLAAASFDGEGLASRRNVLLRQGELQGFLHNSYTGRRSGTGSTGSAVRSYRSAPGAGARALIVEAGAGSLDELIAAVDIGILVQSMTGLHSGVNPVSGDFSVGVEGIMIRRGELAEPVREATIASTLPRLLLDVAAVGGELEWLPGGSGMAPLVVGGVALGGA